MARGSPRAALFAVGAAAVLRRVKVEMILVEPVRPRPKNSSIGAAVRLVHALQSLAIRTAPPVFEQGVSVPSDMRNADRSIARPLPCSEILAPGWWLRVRQA